MPEINRSLGEWAEQLGDAGYAELAAQLHEDKAETIRKLGELGLPHFQSIAITTDAFLQDPDTHFDQLDTPTYYVSVNPTDPRQQRIRAFGMGRDGTHRFVQSVVNEHGAKYGSLILMETAKILYGGNITVSSADGNPVFAELVRGTHADLVGGQQPTLLTLGRNTLTGNFHFDRLHPRRYDMPHRKVRPRHDEQVIRRALFSALMEIPHEAADKHAPGFGLRGTRFRQGYYEVALVQLRQYSRLARLFRRDRHGPLVPIFIDTSDQPAFLPESS
jgi:hypothetical protein